MEGTRPLVVDRTDCWAIHDCLAAQLAGFSGRAESAEPWHALALMTKLAYALPRFEPPHAVDEVTLDLTAGELLCVQCNVPRTAYQGAQALLLRVFHAISELAFNSPILASDPQEPPERRQRLAEWAGYHRNLDGEEELPRDNED